MASKREQVLQAVLALVTAACPGADVARNRDKPVRLGPGGWIVIRDGDPGEPEIDLSPLSYTYEHRIPLELAADPVGEQTAETVLDNNMVLIGQAVSADRTLGGLVDWLDTEAPDPEALERSGAEPGRAAFPAILAIYSSPSPL